MELTIKGTPNEIAALISEIQERRGEIEVATRVDGKQIASIIAKNMKGGIT